MTNDTYSISVYTNYLSGKTPLQQTGSKPRPLQMVYTIAAHRVELTVVICWGLPTPAFRYWWPHVIQPGGAGLPTVMRQQA
jgi:hypothetical protein